MRSKILLICLLLPTVLLASTDAPVLDKAPIDPSDRQSLQRGAQLFMDSCKGCHSLQYMRYKELADGIGFSDPIKENWMYSDGNVNDPIITAMSKEDAAKWFGILPPDLSLTARARGVDWLYTYMRSFYQDDKRPWGVNNKVFPDVAMPHVLNWMQDSDEYDTIVADLVNFLSYVGEPVQVERQRMGIWVLIFLSIFAAFAYLLKREYWKDIK